VWRRHGGGFLVSAGLAPQGQEADVLDDRFDADHLVSGIFVTAAVGLALVFGPSGLAVPVLVALAYACGRLGGRDAGLGSVAAGSVMFGYAITEPHFVWEVANRHDQVLLVVLFVASFAASEIGSRARVRVARRGRLSRR
jgi:K+-sensing histidine kinase KdpD